MTRALPRSRRSAGGSTAFPWRSSWRRREWACSHPSKSRLGSTTRSSCSSPPADRPCRGTGRCAEPSTGGTHCSTLRRPRCGGAGERELTARLVAEEGNFRAAGDWAHETGDHTTSLRLCAALHWHWYARGHFREGWKRLQEALAHADGVPPLHAGKAYVAAAM